jgi:glutamyl-tRNA reductase
MSEGQDTDETLPSVASAIEAIDSCPAIHAMAISSLHLIGLSFRTAELELRGKVSFSGNRLLALLGRLKDAGIAEAIAISTCNRTEIVFVGDDTDCVREVLAEMSDASSEELDGHLYFLNGEDAAAHLFRVCSGLESAVLGETDILAQVKESWRISQEQGCSGPWLSLLMRQALAASKRVRTDTDISRGVTSLGSLAVREASRIAGGLGGKRVLLIGAGKIAERVAKDLVLEKPTTFVVANRTVAAAKALADRHGALSCSLADLEEQLGDADLVLTAVGTDRAIIDVPTMERVGKRRSGRPLMLVDMGVPANVEHDAKQLEFVNSIDVDHLIARSAHNAEKREAAIPASHAIIEESVKELMGAFSEREAAPTIQALVERCQAIRDQNLAWAIDKLGDLDPKHKKIVEDLTLRMVRGLLESPIRSLKGSEIGPEGRELLLKLFEAGGTESK